MGIYWQTTHGYRTSSNYNQNNSTDIKVITDTTNQFIILPQSLNILKSIDPVIDDNDMTLGYVTINNCHKCLKIDPSFFNLNTSEFDKLNRDDVNWYIVEYSYCTYELPEKCNLVFKEQLPIINK